VRHATLAFLCVATLSVRAQSQAPADHYAVTFHGEALRATVDAQVSAADGTLHVAGYTSRQPGYWKSRIDTIVVTDSAGARMDLDSLVAGQYDMGWRIRSGYHGRVSLHYSVNLEFASRPFPSGNQKGGYAADGALYLVTRVLFVTPDSGQGGLARDVELRTPAGWRQVTPWQESSAGHYRVRNRDELVSNSIVVGRFASSRARVGGFEAVAAFVGPIAADSAAIGPAFAKIAGEYFRLFPGTPPGRYLITFFYADHDDGESWASSSAVTFGNRITGGAGILFNNKIAHEVLHYWIGQRVDASDFRHMSWLSEGFTEYFANRTIYRTGLISRAEYLEKLSRHIGAYGYFWYSPLFDDRTLFAAGEDKTRNRFGVYDGGAVVALTLDLMIQRSSNGKHSLDDVLLALWRRFGADGTKYSLDDFVAALTEVGGPEFSTFVPKYITGHELLPLEPALRDFGVQLRAWPLSAEAYLSELTSLDARQRTNHNWLLPR